MKDYDFSDYRTFKKLFRNLYYINITIDEAESKQDEFNTVLHDLKNCSPKHDKYVTLKNNLVDNASKFYEGREKIIEGFKNKIFPLYYDKDCEEQIEFEKEQKEEEEKEIISDVNKINEWVNKQETNISKELFKNHFSFQTPSALLKELYTTNDKEKNILLVSVINSGLEDVKEKIKEISKEEKKIEKPDKIVKIFKEILKFNEQNQQEKGLKIFTPNQMVRRLPITLAQLKAGTILKNLKMK